MKTLTTYTLNNFRTIPQMDAVSETIKRDIEIVGHVLPFKTNNYVVDELIDWSNVENDAIFTLNFPRKGMLSEEHYNTVAKLLDRRASKEELNSAITAIRMELNPNPANQDDNVPMLDGVRLKGVQHKYNETVLFFPTQGQTCHAYCTFCFRWSQFSGISSLKFAMKESDLLLKYLRQNRQVTDVLFTGGDPMVMSGNLLEKYIDPLLSPEFDHIRTIRIGSKSLAYWPYRYLTDSDSTQILELYKRVVKSGKNLSFQAHFNHPQELSTPAVQEAIHLIRKTGAQIRTQSPVMKNINDHADIWAEMWRKQVDLGCIPYYMFMARDTGAKRFFEVPIEEAWNIFRKAFRQVSGVCRTVKGPSMSAHPGKIQVVGVSEVMGEKVFVLNFLQGRNSKWVDKPFFAKYDPNATWIDELKPAFNEKEFFFEEELAG